MRSRINPSDAVLAQTDWSRGALIEAAAATIRKVLPAGWSQETSDSPGGETSLVIMSPDNAITTYLITERGAGYQPHLLKDDELWLVSTSAAPETSLGGLTPGSGSRPPSLAEPPEASCRAGSVLLAQP